MVDFPDFRAAIRESARVLRPGGTFVVANLSFITASTGWERDAEGKRLFRRVDNYAEEHSEVYEGSRSVPAAERPRRRASPAGAG
jgi:ubiquinone/menaquinone biosynthesis C-methylase UbiE